MHLQWCKPIWLIFSCSFPQVFKCRDEQFNVAFPLHLYWGLQSFFLLDQRPLAFSIVFFTYVIDLKWWNWSQCSIWFDSNEESKIIKINLSLMFTGAELLTGRLNPSHQKTKKEQILRWIHQHMIFAVLIDCPTSCWLSPGVHVFSPMILKTFR